MTSNRRIALVAGVLFLITFATSIPALWAYQPVLDNPAGYIAGGGSDNRIFFGALLEMFLIIANVGTAVVLFPILRRRSETLSLGYVTARIIESTFIAIGIGVLAVVSLGQDPGSAASVGQDVASAGGGAQALPASRSLQSRIGPSCSGPASLSASGKGLLLGYLMYTSGLVPRRMALLGLIGGPLIIASGIAVLFDVFQQGGAGQGIATIPEFLWELSLGVYLTVKGFKPSPILEPAS